MDTPYKLDWNDKSIKGATKSALIKSLKNGAEVILDESNKLVPIDEGTLANSGNTSFDEAKLTAYVSYDTPYALRVHDDMNLKHKNGRQSRFLSTALKLNRTRIIDYMKSQLKSELK